MFTALRHRNFRLLWLGLIVSFTGSFMQQAALLWHVSLLAPADGKALALGLVGLVRVVPIVLFSMVFPVVKLLAGLWVWARVDALSNGARRAVGFVGALGKWSMVDVFVVALLVAAIQVSIITNVAIHSGIYVFTGAVLASIALLHLLERALIQPRLKV